MSAADEIRAKIAEWQKVDDEDGGQAASMYSKAEALKKEADALKLTAKTHAIRARLAREKIKTLEKALSALEDS